MIEKRSRIDNDPNDEARSIDNVSMEKLSINHDLHKILDIRNVKQISHLR